MNSLNYYQTLHISQDATIEEIKKAYRHLAFLHHPDRNPMDDKAEEKFKEVNEAYAVLSDPEKKALYDRNRYLNFNNHQTSNKANNFNSDCMRNMGDNFHYGRGMSCRSRGKFGRGCSLRSDIAKNFIFNSNELYEINITFDESLNGTNKILELRSRWERKIIELSIPAGVSNGAIIRLTLADESRMNIDVNIRINII